MVNGKTQAEVLAGLLGTTLLVLAFVDGPLLNVMGGFVGVLFIAGALLPWSDRK